MIHQSRTAISGHQTTDPVCVPPVCGTQQRDPEFIRLPKPPSLCIYSGLTRGKLNELILPCKANGFNPPVKSIVVRQRGKVRGCRLIVFRSLIDHIYSQASEGEGGQVK